MPCSPISKPSSSAKLSELSARLDTMLPACDEMVVAIRGVFTGLVLQLDAKLSASVD